MDTFDNSKQIPEPMLTNVKEAFGGGKNTYADTVLLEQGAQYGYNLAMVQVKDLEQSIRLKDQEIELLKSQIK